jgi:hypothetical protein
VRERLGVDPAGGGHLDAIIAHGFRGAHTFANVAGLEHVLSLEDRVCPDAGETICLQLESDRVLVGLARALLLEFTHFVHNPQLMLHVVADFVGQNTSLGEIPARGAEPALQFVVEGRVDVDGLIQRAIVRPRCGTGATAGRLGCLAE